MQTIGKTEDGRMIVVVTEGEAGILELVRKMIDARFADVALALPATEIGQIRRITEKAGKKLIPPAKKRSAPLRGAATGPVKAKVATGQPICRQCKKPFKRSLDSRQTCCSKECLMAFKRIYARDLYRKKYGMPLDAPVRNTSPINPADPMLSDEQRKELMARREKLIAASAQRHAED